MKEELLTRIDDAAARATAASQIFYKPPQDGSDPPSLQAVAYALGLCVGLLHDLRDKIAAGVITV